jgi:hypothetical protein
MDDEGSALGDVADIKGGVKKCPKCDHTSKSVVSIHAHMLVKHEKNEARAYYNEHRDEIFRLRYGRLPLRQYHHRDDFEVNTEVGVPLTGHIPEGYEEDTIEVVEKIIKTDWNPVMKHRLIQALFISEGQGE